MAQSPPRSGAPSEPQALQAVDVRLRDLSAITEAALAHLELDDLLEEMLMRLREILNVDTAAVLLLDRETNELVARASKGLEEEVEAGVRVPFGGGFAGRIADERRPVVVPVVDDSAVLNPILLKRGVASLLGVPLLVEGDVIGVVHVGSLTPRAFSPDEAELLQLAADRIALAIDHARLYEAEREARESAERQAEELRQLQAITDVAVGRVSLDDDVLPEMLDRVHEVLCVDTAAVLLVSPDGDEVIARAARGLEEEVERGVRIPIGRGFAGRIAAERAPVLLEEVTPDNVVNPLLLEKGIKTLLGVPLMVEDRVIGVLHVGSLTPRVFSDAEKGLLERAADRIAVAVDRSRQHQVAELLQRALLPARLPEVANLNMAARYLPGADDAHVGGDWYDVIPLPKGRVGIAIGDVVSRGVRAAAVMGQIRTALRAYALDGGPPGDVLDRLDQLVRGFEEREMATVGYLVLDPADRSVAFALAGHPPPLVIGSGGGARYLDGVRSRPIGVTAARRYEEATATLEPGETVVLYTDGLVERRGRSLDEGLHELTATAGAAAGGSVDEICDHLLQRAVAETVADDIAVLAVSVPVRPDERLELRLPARPGSLATMRRGLQAWLGHAGVSGPTVYDVMVAVGEAAANAIEHAYGPTDAEFSVDAWLEEGELSVVVRDAGRWRTQRGTHRGRGLAMMRDLMDDVQVESGEDGTAVTMRLRVETGQ
jgi:serine phosphatase RsbU (regulator of sigma subunit)/anti-sigma regulatory factor (Ser/Thr protein kinase)/putative methionine-R-sulfoxide reductase with GAF domain